jgi:integrase
LNDRYTAIIETLLATGIRRSELCNLTWDDFKDNRFILRRTKNKTDRIAKISRPLSEKIRVLPYHNQYVFGSSKGRLLPQKINDELRRRTKSLNIEKTVTAHTLRRTAATEAASKGINLAYIQKFLGHKNVNTTSKYIQVDEIALDQVAKSLTVNEGTINMDDVYDRIRKVSEEFMPNFKVILKRTKNNLHLIVSNIP